jgi:hypothetical protein
MIARTNRGRRENNNEENYLFYNDSIHAYRLYSTQIHKT